MDSNLSRSALKTWPTNAAILDTIFCQWFCGWCPSKVSQRWSSETNICKYINVVFNVIWLCSIRGIRESESRKDVGSFCQMPWTWLYQSKWFLMPAWSRENSTRNEVVKCERTTIFALNIINSIYLGTYTPIHVLTLLLADPFQSLNNDNLACSRERSPNFISSIPLHKLHH